MVTVSFVGLDGSGALSGLDQLLELAASEGGRLDRRLGADEPVDDAGQLVEQNDERVRQGLRVAYRPNVAIRTAFPR